MSTLNLVVQLVLQILFRQMFDLDHLTRPEPFRTVQFSSYDRKSHDRNEWFANDDRGQYLRKDGDEFVLAECDGPGAIVRIWSANPSGTLRIRLDGALVLEADFAKLLSGQVAGFPAPFGEMTSRGGNLYYPFPFLKRMQVTCTSGDLYHHVNVRLYPPGTPGKTWSKDDRTPLPKLDARGAGEPTTERKLSGPGVVRRLEVDLPDDAALLRAATLRVIVDGETCVWSPLGDFFATAPGRTPHHTLPIGIESSGTGYSNFPMPFAESLEVKVDGADVPVRMWVSDDERPLRFHAWWRGNNHLKTRPMSDWPVLNVTGQGHFVGVALAVRNPVKAWWGEGDEHAWVDGEDFPSTFGTGTEDYFGYAWCDPTPFEAPYHCQSRCDGPANFGYTSVARFHVLDPIPFTKSLKFELEVWHWADCEIGYATVAYWYAAPGSTHDFTEGDAKDREIVPLPENVVKGVRGAIEGEKLEVVRAGGGVAEPQDVSFAEGFSREAHLWWRGAKPGDRLALRFPVAAPARAGRAKLAMNFTKAPDYGIVKVSVNGVVVADALDLYATKVMPAGEATFDVELKDVNEIEVEIIGTNDAAKPKNYMFGLDYVRIVD